MVVRLTVWPVVLIWMQIALTQACPEKHTILIQNYDGPIYLTSCQHGKEHGCPLYHITNCPKTIDSDCCKNKIPEQICHDEDICLEGTVSLQLTPHTQCLEVPLYVPPCETNHCFDFPPYYQAPPCDYSCRPQSPYDPNPCLDLPTCYPAPPCDHSCRPQISYEPNPCLDYPSYYQTPPCAPNYHPQIPHECRDRLDFPSYYQPPPCVHGYHSRVPCESNPCSDYPPYYQTPPLHTSRCPCELNYLEVPYYPTLPGCGNEYPYYTDSSHLKAFVKGDAGSMAYWQPKYANHNNCHCCKYSNSY